jgi:hypothetical protein
VNVDIDILRAVEQTYELEKKVSDGEFSPQAAIRALAAGLAQHERSVINRVAAEADAFAAGLHEDPDGTEMAHALMWFAHKLRDEIGPLDPNYVPNEDDVVEVTITGSVELWNPDPGDPDDNLTWAVTDDQTGDTYFFRADPARNPRLRVLSRNKEGAVNSDGGH